MRKKGESQLIFEVPESKLIMELGWNIGNYH